MPNDTDDSKFEKINLPHTWNAVDSLRTARYRRAPAWYRRYITISEKDMKKRVYIRFGAAGQQAEVYINGVKRLSHKGGYTAFALELTNFMTPGANRIDVRVNNAHDNTLIPHSADYTFYGGLYRSVHLIRGPVSGFCRAHHAGPALRVYSDNISSLKSILHAAAILDSHSTTPQNLTLNLSVTDPDGSICAKTSMPITIPPAKPQSFELPPVTIYNPQLWSPESPALYNLNFTLADKSGAIIDSATIHHGIRYYKFTPNQGFFLNGKQYKLNGVNRHQDLYMHGNALSPAEHEQDIRTIKESGANWLRLAHYTQHDFVLDLCDELGILVWEENPWVNGTSYKPEFLQNMKSMMTEMITQHFNHPSIVVWGISNEVRLKNDGNGKALQTPLFHAMNDLIHKLDPTRVSGLVAGNTSSYAKLGVMDIPDVIGYNLYCGWYGGSFSGFAKRATQFHKMNPDKPMLITEYGAGSDQRIHSLKPQQQDFSEEWQMLFFESYQKQAKQLPWLCGMTWWAFADFGSASRGNSIPHVNQKGMLTFDRHKKDLFYAAKALWRKEPVLHIQGSAWTNRTGDATQNIHVITNMRSVELLHNAQSLGTQTTNFTWNVHFTPGKNTLIARGKTDDMNKTNTITVNWQKAQQHFKVTATAQQNDTPIQNIADGNHLTRWSCDGNATINIDLGHPALLDGIRFDLYRGQQRHYKFEISLSNSNKSFTKVFSGSSHNKTEEIRFKQTEARYIRIKALGNNKNNWNSYFEVEPIIATKIKNKNTYEKIGAGEL